MYNEHTKTNDNNKKVQDQEQRRSPSTLQSIWSLFNGQFLYKESKRAQNNGIKLFYIFRNDDHIKLINIVICYFTIFRRKIDFKWFCPHHYIPYAHEIKNGYKVFMKMLTG